MGGSVLDLVALTASVLLSWLEDQRSIRPSDLMIVYFAVTGILSLPRARTLWLLPAFASRSAVVWTLVCFTTVAVLFVESVHKTRVLRTIYRQPSKEVTASFWVRSFFTWVLPLFRRGYSKVLSVQDMPDVDTALQGTEAEMQLQNAWNRSRAAFVPRYAGVSSQHANIIL